MRLFIGLSLPQEARAAVSGLAKRAQQLIPGRYVPAENYHITLAFLGQAQEADVPRIAAVLTRCLSAVPAPRLAPASPDVFGRMENGILVLRMHSEPALDPLHSALAHALRARGLPVTDGPFAPHVTLARHACASPQALSALGGDAQRVPAFRAARAHLYLSARDEAGLLRYTPLLDSQFSPSLASFDAGL